MYGKSVAAMMLTLISTIAFGQGEGPVASEATYERKVDWLIEEIGVSEDGYTIRQSIDVTDKHLNEVVQTVATDLNELRESIETTDTFVFGGVLLLIVGLGVYMIRIRVRLAYLEGLSRAGQMDSDGGNDSSSSSP